MADQPSAGEMEIAGERIRRLTNEFSRKRAVSFMIASILILIGYLALTYGQPITAFNFVVVALIFALRCLDAHGMVHDVQRRSTKTLYPRLSLLEPSGTTKASTEPGIQK